MYGGSQNDGNSLFSGGGFMPSQATQTPDSGVSPAKSRGTQGVLPLTVKQISEAFHSSDDKSGFVIDGVDASNVRLLGMVTKKMERVTDVSFTLDDGTGRIDVNRWVNEAAETNEMAAITNGMYVKVNGNLKGFQGKRHVVAFSVRPVTDFNDITNHFLECIHIHLCNTRLQYSAPSSMGGSENDIYNLVLGVFQEPASVASEHGLHVDEVARRLGIPMNKIKDAINYHVDIGHIYSTIDDNHFKSACNG
ncbi:Replication protein A 32 kDa subunit A [Acorus calamus]|uniref:Replication protein A 32 kDa subunit A n=1 Tax=Acorus calamus TaxID=4465 RepID=A0AAV9CT57_ACOCL|nr:Replication protein A 32 kDa subunit A [Acorus calamus]